MSNVIASFKAKLQKIDSDMKANAAVLIKIGLKRKLTSGEITMSKLIFKDAIDYSKVWVRIGGAIHNETGNAMTIDGEISLPLEVYKAIPDFSVAAGEERHWFIHEMTHVWQYQMDASPVKLGLKQLCTGGYTSEVYSKDTGRMELKAYHTDLLGRDLNKKFQDFNFEQQGEIIEFYFDAIYLQKVNPTRKHHKDSLRLLGYVKRILQNFILNPYDKNLLPR